MLEFRVKYHSTATVYARSEKEARATWRHAVDLDDEVDAEIDSVECVGCLEDDLCEEFNDDDDEEW